MLNQPELWSMKDRINAVLRELGAGHVAEVWRDPRAGVHSFILALTNYSRWPSVISATKTLELAAGRPVTVGRSHGQPVIRIADDTAQAITLDELLPFPPDDVTPMTVPLGVISGGPARPGGGPPGLWLRIGSNRSNVLIVAPPGMGKTMLAHTILIGLARRNAQRPEHLRIILCDPKNHGLSQVQAALGAHLDGLHQSIDSVRRALVNMARLVEHAEPTKVETVVFVDELYNVMRDAEAAEAVETILRMGREFRYRLIACSPEAGRSPLAGPAMGLWHIRLVGRQADVTTAAVASGISGSGAEALAGAGHFMAVFDGQVRVFRAAMPPATYDDEPVRIEPEQTAQAQAMPVSMGIPVADQRDDTQDRERDAAVYQELAAQLGQPPGVTAWAKRRFPQWQVPYAGNRITWMRPRYNAVLTGLGLSTNADPVSGDVSEKTPEN